MIFSEPSIKAILDGRKTQTRRVVVMPKWLRQMEGTFKRAVPDKAFGVTPCLHIMVGDGSQQRLRNPWDWPQMRPVRLWVRESWQDYCPLWRGYWCGHGTAEGIANDHQPVYRADGPSACMRPIGKDGEMAVPNKWRSPIHMPRWASRITLEITGIRAERLQQISVEDIITEGFSSKLREHDACCDLKDQFRAGWDLIHNKREATWDRNPWVWVIEFRRFAAEMDGPFTCDALQAED